MTVIHCYDIETMREQMPDGRIKCTTRYKRALFNPALNKDYLFKVLTEEWGLLEFESPVINRLLQGYSHIGTVTVNFRTVTLKYLGDNEFELSGWMTPKLDPRKLELMDQIQKLCDDSDLVLWEITGALSDMRSPDPEERKIRLVLAAQ